MNHTVEPLTRLAHAVAQDLKLAWLLTRESPMEAAVHLSTGNAGEIELIARRDGHRIPVTLLKDTVAIPYVLHNKSGMFTNKPVIRHLDPIAGKGVVTAGDRLWNDLRSYMMHDFGGLTHRPNIAQQMVLATEEMFARWQPIPTGGRVLDFTKEFRRLPSDIFLRSFFGLKSDEKTREMQEHVHAIFHCIVSSIAHPVGSSIGKLRHQDPYKGKLDRLRALANKIIETRRRELEDPGFAGNELLSHLVKKYGASDAERDVLLHNVLTLFAAGYETTSTGFVFAAKEFTEHRDVWTRIVREVDEKLGGKRPESLADLDKLTFLQAAVKEVLRLHPPLSFIIREAAGQDRIPLRDGKAHPVAKGDIFVISSDAVHRDPVNFKRPNDLVPGRFVVGDPDYVPDPSTYLTFGAGQRSCLGQRFATYELMMVFALIAQKYDFAVIHPEQIKMHFDLTSHPDRTAMAVVSPRRAMAPAA